MTRRDHLTARHLCEITARQKHVLLTHFMSLEAGQQGMLPRVTL